MLVTLVFFIYLLTGQGRAGSSVVLTVHCAAGLQKPIREIARRYEAENDVKIVLNLAGSGVLESQLKVAGGDLYIPADESYILKAKSEGLISDVMPLVSLRAVIVVQRGNPEKISSLEDLQKAGVRLSMADPTAAIGSYVEAVLRKSGDWAALSRQVIVTKPTVNHVIEDVANKTVDATLAWDSVAASYDDVELVRVAVFDEQARLASVGLIKNGNTRAARLFMRYLACDPAAGNVFKGLGYELARSEGCSDE